MGSSVLADPPPPSLPCARPLVGVGTRPSSGARARDARCGRGASGGAGAAVLVVGGVHGDEPTSVGGGAGRCGAPAAGVAAAAPLWLVPAAQPRRARARREELGARRRPQPQLRGAQLRRAHAPGYFPGAAPLSEPETRALAGLVEARRSRGVVAVHAPFACVNYDGPAAAWAEEVAAACGWPARGDIGYPTPGSLGQLAGRRSRAARPDAGAAAGPACRVPPAGRGGAGRRPRESLRMNTVESRESRTRRGIRAHFFRLVTVFLLCLLSAMDKELERRFLETISRTLVSLPFDLKVLLEAVADSDLEHGVRELAAATVVHVITPKDGNVERPCASPRTSSAAPRAGEDRGRGRRGRARLPGALRRGLRPPRRGARRSSATVFGDDVVEWLDSRWGALRRRVYAKKKIRCSSTTRRSAPSSTTRGCGFATNYPITEKSLAGRVKQGQPFIDHLARKRDQDRKKITS